MPHNIQASRSLSTSIVRLILLLSAYIPAFRSSPLYQNTPFSALKKDHDVEGDPGAPRFWIYIGTACLLVLFGGVFAGLTLALMGQDEIYLTVIEQSGEETEKKAATKVLKLLRRGKHWVLVTLLLSNVITNETLPIVLDRSLGGGWPAVVASTGLIVIFGEIIPQSVCVRYGLGIGAYLSPFVLFLMYAMYPLAYPVAMLLDYVLGEDHGTTYKKAGLKTLVTLHKTIGEHPAERLNQDEVTIISAVLDLKDKPVGSIMTPIDDVFTMDSETVLDEDTMDKILGEGYSRIPIHAPGEPTNFIGMLLVKILITYDPEDAMKVKDFPLATLPETAPETSCLDIVNFFQEGKSHMVLVSESPGQNYGALGVLTLEDVIEELIGEEIVDESDVYVDVHKAIRRLNPSPIARRTMSALVPKDQLSDKTASAAANTVASAIAQNPEEAPQDLLLEINEETPNGQRRYSAGDLPGSDKPSPVKRKMSGKFGISQEMSSHFKHLGPSNRASSPLSTTSKMVKIKPGHHDDPTKKDSHTGSEPPSRKNSTQHGRSVSFADPSKPQQNQALSTVDESTSLTRSTDKQTNGNKDDKDDKKADDKRENQKTYGAMDKSDKLETPAVEIKTGSHSPIRNEMSVSPNQFATVRVRTGSIIERHAEVGGIKKVVVEATSSDENSEDKGDLLAPRKDSIVSVASSSDAGSAADGAKKKKKKKKNKKNKKATDGNIKEEDGEDDDAGESTGLLDGKK